MVLDSAKAIQFVQVILTGAYSFCVNLQCRALYDLSYDSLRIRKAMLISSESLEGFCFSFFQLTSTRTEIYGLHLCRTMQSRIQP